MRARLTGASAVLALAVFGALPPVAGAQDLTPTPTPTETASPTPTATATPTPTPTPTPEEEARARRDERDRNSKNVRRIYRDFERDGFIDDCDHPRRALVRARRSIEDSYAEEYPDFRDALTAAIQRHDDGDCVEEQPPTDEPSDGSDSDGGGTTPGTTTPPPATPPPAAPPPPPATTPESGNLPDFGDSGGAGGGGGGLGGGGLGGGSGGGNPDSGVIPSPGEDAIPEGTASPQPTPAPPAAPPEPKLIVTKTGADPNMFVPGTMLAIALVGLLLAGLSALAARRSERFAGVAHAWREAAWRTSGTWHDFTDWLRLSR